MAISVMPPGEVASSSVTGCSPVSSASSQANTADTASSASVCSTLPSSQRGAPWAKAGVKRTPRLMPITSCAALDSGLGTLLSWMSSAAISIATSSAPRNHGFGRRVARMASTPAPVSSASSAKPSGWNRSTAGTMSIACRCQCCLDHWMAKGSTSTTTVTRTVWAAATRSVRAPARSASRVISEAPPIDEA